MSSCSSDVFMVAFYSSEVCNEYNTTVMYLGMLFAMLFTGSSHGVVFGLFLSIRRFVMGEMVKWHKR